MILRFLNWQGIAGLAASVGLLGLLIVQHMDATHWHRESDRFEKLYTDEQLALAKTTAAYREAADKAEADDKANARRIAAQQSAINQESSNDFEKRLADARAAADRLRQELAAAPADPGGRGAAAVPGLSVAPGGPAQAAGQDGLSDALTATEQAIQLDELILWVRRQHSVDPNANDEERPKAARAPAQVQPGADSPKAR
jgi:hypothetical protein